MEPQGPPRAKASPPGAGPGLLSAALLVALCVLVIALSAALDSASVGAGPSHQSWLARAIDLTSPRLERAGGWLVATGLAGWCVGLVLRASWPRLRGTLLLGGVVVAVLGLVAVTDAACLAGHRTPDGTCAWE